MNKAILTVIAISTLFLGFSGKVIYADDEAEERVEVALKPGGTPYKVTDEDGNKFIVRCLKEELPKCTLNSTSTKVRVYIGSTEAISYQINDFSPNGISRVVDIARQKIKEFIADGLCS